MQKQWHIFKIVVIIQLIMTSFFVVILAVSVADLFESDMATLWQFYLLAVAILFLLLAFYIVNGLLIFKHYPDRPMSLALKISFTTLHRICCVLECLLLFMLISGIIDLSKMNQHATKWGYAFMLFLFFIYFILMLHSLIYAYRLSKLITKNVNSTLLSNIDNMGKLPIK